MSGDEKEPSTTDDVNADARVENSIDNLVERARRRLSRAVFNLLDVYTLINAADGAPSFAAHFDVLGDLIHAWCDLVQAPEEDVERALRTMLDKVMQERREDAAAQAKEAN